MLCALPAVIGALPAGRAPASLTPEVLRQRVRASAAIPYAGLVETQGSLGLPALPGLTEAIEPLGGSTRMRVWYAARTRWRVDVLTVTGERGFLQSPQSLVVWDYERNSRTKITGEPALRLPRAADLVPPDLARRLLGAVAPGDRLTGLPVRRVAGVRAAGLRVVPGDPASTIGSVEIWADPRTGLPVEVRLAPRGSRRTVIRSRFLDLSARRPAPSALAPTPAPGVAESTIGASSLAFRLPSLSEWDLPDSLAGRPALELQGPVEGIRTYGGGFGTFVAVALPGRYGRRIERAARRAGAGELTFAGGKGLLIRTPLLAAMLTHDVLDRYFLLAGPVGERLLHDAAADLIAIPGGMG